ncbi:MAG: hypothetical protein BGO77_05120 [Caedibacter sp. 37-49]|nr:MAG: hypothetical protein BGO77_05120 [Caedibacter sp. 37-49]
MYYFLILLIFISPSQVQALSLVSNPKKEMAAWYDLLIAREAVNRTREAAIKAANDPTLKELRKEEHKVGQELEQKIYEAYKFFKEGLIGLNLQIDTLRRRLKNQLEDKALAEAQKKSAERLNGLLDKVDKWTFKYSQNLTNTMREYTQANVQGKVGQFENIKTAVQELEREINEKAEDAERLVISLKGKEEYQMILERWREISERLIKLKKDSTLKIQTNLSSFNDQATKQLDILKKAIGPSKCKNISTIADISDQKLISCAVTKISSESKMLDLPGCKQLEIQNGSKKRTVSKDKSLKEYRDCIGLYINKKWPY